MLTEPATRVAYSLTAEGAAMLTLVDLTALLAAHARAAQAWRVWQAAPATLAPVLRESLRREWCASEAALSALLEGPGCKP